MIGLLLRTKIVFKETVKDELGRQKNVHLGKCLSVVDALVGSQVYKTAIRKAILDNFNDYHRVVEEQIEKI